MNTENSFKQMHFFRIFIKKGRTWKYRRYAWLYSKYLRRTGNENILSSFCNTHILVKRITNGNFRYYGITLMFGSNLLADIIFRKSILFLENLFLETFRNLFLENRSRGKKY